ncbi:hypothetical protein OTU49_006892 [Cherax quadricarinatus]|uniref:Uncharacterized protein n=1 Tax=Cherax quadricarinatus TaxID=27406 RepID=A0AAW0WZ22_CHEQU|nr:uncharacterized protein LOC128700749 [Cherax quadricarinatus]
MYGWACVTLMVVASWQASCQEVTEPWQAPTQGVAEPQQVPTQGVVEPQQASTQGVDHLDCSAEEENAAKQSVVSSLRELYFPLLDETSGSIRELVNNRNNVKMYIDCIIENKTCTRLGKSLQHFVTDEAGNNLCFGCQPCQKQRIKYILRQLKCNYNDQAKRIEEYILKVKNINIYTFFNLQNIVCELEE